jgi:hypothetical protein
VTEKRGILGGVDEGGLLDAAQNAGGIVLAGFPEDGIETPEQADGGFIPTPPQIVNQFAQGFDPGG